MGVCWQQDHHLGLITYYHTRGQRCGLSRRATFGAVAGPEPLSDHWRGRSVPLARSPHGATEPPHGATERSPALWRERTSGAVAAYLWRGRRTARRSRRTGRLSRLSDQAVAPPHGATEPTQRQGGRPPPTLVQIPNKQIPSNKMTKRIVKLRITKQRRAFQAPRCATAWSLQQAALRRGDRDARRPRRTARRRRARRATRRRRRGELAEQCGDDAPETTTSAMLYVV